MKTNLVVLGQGAVSPAGVGAAALFGPAPVPVPTAPVGNPDRTRPALRVDLKDPAFARWQAEPRMRRASPYTLFLAEAASQALDGLDAARKAATGLVVASSMGCLGYSRRFYEGIVTHGRKGAGPALFPDTVYNSPVSHVAATLGLGRAAYALVGDETAWIDALQTASLWLRRGDAERVLVLGAEEFDPIVLDAAAMAGERDRFVASEGAGGLLVGLAGNGPAVIEARSGAPWRSRREKKEAEGKCLAALAPLPVHRPALPRLGSAFTASAAWETIRALGTMGEAKESQQLGVPIFGSHCRAGALVLGSEAE